MNAIEFNHVWKKFNKGEKIYALRDAIPYFFRKAIGGNNGLENKEFWALKDVSFSIEKGEVVGIIGPNGAGKSTTLKLLSRILVPNKGEIKIQGKVSALIEITAGFHPELTGRENVFLNGTILGMRKKEIERKFDEIVDFSGIEEFIDTPVKRYSSGMYARLGFSVAAHMDPDILLVDEVLAVGDMAFQAKCAEKMRSLLKIGATVIMVSHNLFLIQSMSKRVLLFNKGEIIKDAKPEEVVPYYQNLVYQEKETELRKRTKVDDYKIHLAEESAIEIQAVRLLGNNETPKETFAVGEPLSISIDFVANKEIEQPIFCVEIVRSDSVVCCLVESKADSLVLNKVGAKGEVLVDLGRINLAPGIYETRISVWDKDVAHPFAIREKDIFRIETDASWLSVDSVFLPQAKWKFK